jgi:hypothetical protein
MIFTGHVKCEKVCKCFIDIMLVNPQSDNVKSIIVLISQTRDLSSEVSGA